MRQSHVNADPQRVFQQPGSRGFVLNQKQKQQIENKDSKSSEVIFPHLVGRDVLTGDGMPTSWVIDFGDSDQLTAASHSAAFEHVKNTVLVKMEKIAAGEIPRKTMNGSWINFFALGLATVAVQASVC